MLVITIEYKVREKKLANIVLQPGCYVTSTEILPSNKEIIVSKFFLEQHELKSMKQNFCQVENNMILETRTRADQHKCLPHLACINPTLLFVEYFSVFGQ